MRRFSGVFPQQLTRRHISTRDRISTRDHGKINFSCDDITNDLTVNNKIRLSDYFSVLIAWTVWVVADQLDPLRANRNGGPGHKGGWLFLATLLLNAPGIPACIAVVATVSNLFCVRNLLCNSNPLISVEEKKALK